MKSLKFNRKRIAICICFLFIIILSIISVQAFSFREQSRVVSSYPDLPSSEALPYLVGVLQYQLDINPMGRCSYLQVLYVVQSGSSYQIYAILSKLESTVSSVTSSGDDVTFSFGVSSQYGYNDEAGFFEIGSTPGAKLTVDSRFILYSDYTVPATSIPSFSGPNYNASFGSSNFNSFDVYSYYEYIYDSAVYRVERESTIRQEAQSEGESIGFEEGAEAGYFHGYDIGYADGLDEGEANGIEVGKGIGYETGYESGYADGLDDGYDTGYDTGYADGYKRGEDIGFESGYNEGYSDGYETGYQSGLDNCSGSEPLQIYTAYIFRFDENNALQYSWYNDSLRLFAWVDYDSRFDPTKPPFTFIVRLTESDLNNSSTQIELPFDFISSPANRDYSVSSFDPEFLSGYGRSLSLFVTTSRSYNNGYNVGLQDGADLLDGISDISAKPIAALRDALDFELFGVNIGLVVVAIVSVLIVFAAYKFVKKIFPI